MNILIVGDSGSGKSNLGDFIRNLVFKLDREASITTDDLDREVKTFGSGKNVYNLKVQRSPTDEEVKKADIVISLNNKAFSDWFKIFGR